VGRGFDGNDLILENHQEARMVEEWEESPSKKKEV